MSRKLSRRQPPREEAHIAEKETQTAGTPRWVKAFTIVALVVVVLIAVMLVAGRGGHGPGRHAPSGDDGPPAETGGHAPPTGAHTQP